MVRWTFSPHMLRSDQSWMLSWETVFSEKVSWKHREPQLNDVLMENRFPPPQLAPFVGPVHMFRSRDVKRSQVPEKAEDNGFQLKFCSDT